MRRIGVYSMAAALVVVGLAFLRQAGAQPDSTHATHEGSHAAAHPAEKAAGGEAAGGGMRALMWHQIAAAQEKLVSLAEAMPADKYAWRPGDGVRSVGEVYMHVASANYFLPTFFGAKMPAGVDPRGFEKEGGDKAKTVATLKQSFDFLHQAMDAVPEADLGKAIKIFGRDATVGDAMMILVSHAHEHLGQSIAYARMNSVVPPWSAAGAQRGR